MRMTHPNTMYAQVAQLHVDGIKGGFLPTLGLRFLVLLYRAIDEAEGSVLIMETEGSRVLGFAASGHGMMPIYKRMLYRFPALALALFPQILSPRKLRGIFEILSHGYGGGNGMPDEELPKHELFSIVVAPEMRGKGIADKLYTRLLQHFAECGVAEFKILVGKDLIGAHQFYQRMGAHPKFEVDFHKGSASTVYIQKVPIG
jgi:ribosomal protein S18 acetylase RimI-like enzyme